MIPHTFILTTLLWLFIIQCYVTIHFYIIEIRRQTPVHAISWLTTLIICLFISGTAYDTITERILCIFYLGTLYWILFSLQLNFFRQKPLLYLGIDSDPEEDSWLDKFEKMAANPIITLVIKIILVLLSGICLITL